MNLKRKGMMEYIHIRLRGPPRVTYVSDEAAWLLLLEELADSGPGFALQVTEAGRGALVHIMHVLLLQLGGRMVHPGESGPCQGMRFRAGTGNGRWRCRFPKMGAYDCQGRAGFILSFFFSLFKKIIYFLIEG